MDHDRCPPDGDGMGGLYCPQLAYACKGLREARRLSVLVLVWPGRKECDAYVIYTVQRVTGHEDRKGKDACLAYLT